ncbi:MAG: hypothetical protein CFK52_02870 [Chloracidobacterium sp. CP2_5A]|nr:MAG: hypothetical protein CFK52_02870 [Chloracidobacterium sp. CP2_5A]
MRGRSAAGAAGVTERRTGPKPARVRWRALDKAACASPANCVRIASLRLLSGGRALEIQLSQFRPALARRHRPDLVARCFLWACWLWPRVRWGTLPAALRYLDRRPDRGTGRALAPLPAESVAQAAGAITRRLPRLGVGECLLRSLVIYAVLRRQRLAEIEFVLGAGPLDEVGRPALHCWIEANGRPLLETADPRHRFRVLLRHRMPEDPNQLINLPKEQRHEHD